MLGLLLLILALLGNITRKIKPEAVKPNILVIMADDMGYSDLGCYGGEIKTPNLDRLAANGLRFRNAYNTARCCPTRASLLTGQYQHKVGLDRNGKSLTRDGVTIAEALKPHGYQTGMVGKWHLSEAIPLKDKAKHLDWLNHQYDPGIPFAEVSTYPINRGFDKHYGIIWGVVSYYDPFSLVEGDKPVKTVGKDYYITDDFSQKATEYIRDFTKKDDPFFLYLAYTSPHWPIQAPQEDIERYLPVYQEGWDVLQQKRRDRQIKMGLLTPQSNKLSPIQGRKWAELSAAEKEFNTKKMATHAAMVARMDRGIGQVLKTLEETGALDNTLIVFMSDNGASPEIMHVSGYDRPSETRSGEKLLYADAIPVADIGKEISYTGIGPEWANAINSPYRLWKAESIGGGIRTPMIVHWKGLKTPKGSVSDELTHVMDIMPTLLDLTDIPYPKVYQGNTIKAMDGQSLLPVLLGKKRPGYAQLFFEHEGGKALIEGDWKLVAPKRKAWELYDLKADRTESDNLMMKNPAKAADLKQKYEAWSKRMGVSE
ncbi:sulfatase-like hydrolase/transferase [Cytophagaceae bacterium SJW1-29]|uniref:Sulfatase-like hydrolase/transferase n=2 Tax=Salmonirosea aquatica TaxID=2654236 RepID=A0A7C9FN10_9BACT|nr:sulfatase-like hydrolase/transferase [Cytophagaceae bacterium SJW1-29]